VGQWLGGVYLCFVVVEEAAGQRVLYQIWGLGFRV
jgi:hypothetical protein